MTLPFIVNAVFRWAGFAALAALVGSHVLDVLVLPWDSAETGAVRERLGRLNIFALVVLVVTTIAELVARAQTMAGGSLAAAMPAIPLVLARTHFGAIWTGRLIVLALALLLAFIPSRGPRVVSLFLALALTVSTTLTGHAADWGSNTRLP